MSDPAPVPAETTPVPVELVAIVAAMEDEIAPLRARVVDPEEIVDGPRRYLRGRLRGIDVVLSVTGDGKRNADHGIRRLIQKCAPTRLLAIGLAGGLSPKLRAGELLVSSEVLEGDRVLGWPDLQWLEEAAVSMEFDLGRMVTVDEILSSPEQKAEWWGKTPRDQAAAVDMESACYARVAIAYNLPYLVARVISDTAEESLPSFLEDCRAQDGSVDRRQVTFKAFWRPASWRPLLRLRGRMRRAAVKLADFAEGLVGSLAGATPPAAPPPSGSTPPAGAPPGAAV